LALDVSHLTILASGEQQMQPTTIKELDCLHDSDLLGIMYDTSGDADWPIRLTILCPDDMGYAPWDGKLLVLSAIDVVRSKHVVCRIANSETIDHVLPRVSVDLREGAVRARGPYAHFNFEFTISFISGSTLEVICQELQIEVGS
jgi:hypothetical protein